MLAFDSRICRKYIELTLASDPDTCCIEVNNNNNKIVAVCYQQDKKYKIHNGCRCNCLKDPGNSAVTRTGYFGSDKLMGLLMELVLGMDWGLGLCYLSFMRVLPVQERSIVCHGILHK